MTATALAARAGGLAVALGIGAALASAAPAWASPEDASGATASTGSAESRPTKARAGHAVKRSQPKAASAGSDGAGPAATGLTMTAVAPKPTAPPRRQLGAVSSARTQTEPTPALGQSAVSAAPVTGAAAESSPIHDLLATLFPWFDPRGQRIFVPKGWQYSLPPQYAFFIKKVSGHATFTTDSAYDVNGVDQYDWLKLTGMTFTPWRPDTDAIMVAWRYNLDTEMFEVGPYYNVDLARIMPTEDEIISLPPDAEFEFYADYDGITLTYGDQTVYKPIPADLHPGIWTANRINGWFGGTSAAPRTVSYYLHLDCF